MLDWQAPLPATWTAACLLALVHLGSGLTQVLAGRVGPLQAWLLSRSVQMRVAVGGQYRLRVEEGEWWRLFTSTLLHGDLLHLAVNVAALLALGRVLEPWIGGRRMLAWGAAGAVAGSVASQLAQVNQSDGASGGAFALLGAAVVLGWRASRLLDPESRRLLGPVLGGFLALNVVLSFVLPFVDAAGHLGGLAVGLLAGAIAPFEPGRTEPRVLVAAEWGWLVLFLAVCALGWLGGLS